MDDKEIEFRAYREVQRMRRILFDLCLEDYIREPEIVKTKWKGKEVILLSPDEWKTYQTQVSEAVGDLFEAREIIQTMKPVFDEYAAEYEAKHNISFDEYMNLAAVSYDADEFERVREQFENEYYKEIDER